MSKITLSQIADLTQSTTAQTTINSNSTTVQTAFDNTLSRDGTSPNQMGSNLDMNANQILNLPSPATVNSPARLIDVASNPTITVPPVGTSGAVVPLLNANNTWSGVQTFNAVTNTDGINTGNVTTTGTITASGNVTAPAYLVTGVTSGSVTVDTFNPVASGTVLVPNGPATLLSTAGSTRLGVTGGNPTSTASIAGVMMGLGASFTINPTYSTRYLIMITGNVQNNTASDGLGWHIRFGTGTAPVNGAALTGTSISGSSFTINNANTAGISVGTSNMGIATSLAPGTTYWVDVGLAALTGGTCSIQNVVMTALEI